MQISHKSFRNIGLIGRPDKYSVVETLCLIHDHLITLGLNPVFDQETAKLVPYSYGQTVSRNLLGEVVDLVIVVDRNSCENQLNQQGNEVVKWTYRQ